MYFIYTSLHLTQLLHKKKIGISSVAQNIHILKLDNTHISHEPGAIDYLLHPAQQISDSLEILLLHPA